MIVHHFLYHLVPEAPTCRGRLRRSRTTHNCLYQVGRLHPFSTVCLWLSLPSEPDLFTKAGGTFLKKTASTLEFAEMIRHPNPNPNPTTLYHAVISLG